MENLAQEAISKAEELLVILDWFKNNNEALSHLHKNDEEKMQILLHNLQNNEFPKSPKKFVTELKAVRTSRWISGRIRMIKGEILAIANSNGIGCMRGHLNSLNSPKLYKAENIEYQKWSLNL